MRSRDLLAGLDQNPFARLGLRDVMWDGGWEE
jgi:hypothetical protein